MNTETKTKAAIALVLLVPVPSLGVLCGMIWFPDAVLGKVLFSATKIWILALPVAWWWIFYRRAEHRLPACAASEASVEKPSKAPEPHSPEDYTPLSKGIVASILAGVAILLLIVGAYVWLGDKLIDKEFFVGKLRDVGLGDKRLYFGAMMYWILVNSLLEEFVWRWFVTERFSKLVPPVAAVLLSALCFTLHHTLAMSVYLAPLANAAASVGVFTGGVIFSWLFVRYKSIWPPYIAHVFADIAIFAIGYVMLFG